jgi:hypothetical protein
MICSAMTDKMAPALVRGKPRQRREILIEALEED